MNELALFAGSGGGILGGKLLGWRTVCAVEFDSYARRVLLARQADGCLPKFPIWDDVRTFDGRPWRGHVDVVSGGFPCQDISLAGKGAGIGGERSGLWGEMARIIGEVGPRFVFVENSPALTSRGLGTVLGDLASMGYDAQWGVLGAVDAGAPHRRKRIWIVGHADSLRKLQPEGREQNQRRRACDPSAPGIPGEIPNPNGVHVEGLESRAQPRTNGRPTGLQGGTGGASGGWWESEPDVGRVAHGVAHRVDRLRCLGNGQVPAVVRLAWNFLTNTKPTRNDH